jgi:hypothetical protein
MRWLELVRDALARCQRSWVENAVPISWEHLAAYYQLSLFIHPLPSGPYLEPVWDRTLAAVESATRESETEPSTVDNAIDRLLKLVDVLRENEPRFLRAMRFPASAEAQVAGIASYARDVAEALVDDPLGFESDEVDSAEELANSLRDLEEKFPGLAERLEDARSAIFGGLDPAREAHEEAAREDSDRVAGFDPDPDDYPGQSDTEPFDLAAFFSDL